MAGIGIILGLMVFSIGGLVLGIIECIQASGYPDWAFERAGTNKFVWQIVPIILIFACSPAAFVMYFIWTGTRERVSAMASQAPPPGYGYPPPYQQPPPYPQQPPPPAPPPQ